MLNYQRVSILSEVRLQKNITTQQTQKTPEDAAVVCCDLRAQVKQLESEGEFALLSSWRMSRFHD